MWWIESNRFSPLTRQPLSNKPMLCCECALASSGKKAPPLAKVLVTTRHLSNTSERDNIILKIEKPPGRNRKGSSSTGMFEVFIGTTRYNKEKGCKSAFDLRPKLCALTTPVPADMPVKKPTRHVMIKLLAPTAAKASLLRKLPTKSKSTVCTIAGSSCCPAAAAQTTAVVSRWCPLSGHVCSL